MPQAQEGNTVKIHYTCTFADGTPVDDSRKRQPIEFEVGQKKVMPAFEAAVVGMSPGETKSITVPPEQAYGLRKEAKALSISRDKLPEGVDPQVGVRLGAKDGKGRTLPVTITEVTDDAVTIDANHPLAGKELTFEIELLEVS